jgi:hypothetical protein
MQGMKKNNDVNNEDYMGGGGGWENCPLSSLPRKKLWSKNFERTAGGTLSYGLQT